MNSKEDGMEKEEVEMQRTKKKDRRILRSNEFKLKMLVALSLLLDYSSHHHILESVEFVSLSKIDRGHSLVGLM